MRFPKTIANITFLSSVRASVLQRLLPADFPKYFPIDCAATLLVWLKRENK